MINKLTYLEHARRHNSGCLAHKYQPRQTAPHCSNIRRSRSEDTIHQNMFIPSLEERADNGVV